MCRARRPWTGSGRVAVSATILAAVSSPRRQSEQRRRELADQYGISAPAHRYRRSARCPGGELGSELGDSPSMSASRAATAPMSSGVSVRAPGPSPVQLVQVPASRLIILVRSATRSSRWSVSSRSSRSGPSSLASGRPGSRSAARATASASIGRTCRSCGPRRGHGPSASAVPARSPRPLPADRPPAAATGAGVFYRPPPFRPEASAHRTRSRCAAVDVVLVTRIPSCRPASSTATTVCVRCARQSPVPP